MAHEELKKQWAEDRINYGKNVYNMWEFKPKSSDKWTCVGGLPCWDTRHQYRRKEPAFEPEYFSGLNWREAKKWLNRLVECSMDGESWHGPFTLKKIDDIREHLYKYHCCRQAYPYIRTCPQTHAHPNITIGGVELPRPEVEAPEYNQKYFTFDCNEQNRIFSHTWWNDQYDKRWLRYGIVHLTKDRAQAWADWWKNIVMAAVKGK